MSLIFGATEFCLHLLLLFGIHMRRATWLLVYVWVQAILMSLVLIFAVVYLFVDLVLAMVTLFLLPVFVYFELCVKSLYQEMNEN